MKEQGITLTKITQGLRKHSDGPFNSEALTECFNVIPRVQGLVPAPTIIGSLVGISADYPFPQIFFGFRHWVCCTRDKVYTINGDYTVTLQLDLSVYYNSFPTAPQGVWRMADFHDYVVLTNGGVTINYDPVSGIWEYNDVATMPTLGTVCNYNGQLVGSGREAIVGDPKTTHPDASEVDSNYLLWGKIGAASFRLDQGNVSGYRPMPWYGEIYHVMKLGNPGVVVVYGASGIAIIKFEGVAPGIIETFDFGIASRGAVGGGVNFHGLVDTAGNFRVLTKDLKMSEPEYQEYFSPMLGDEIIVSHNPTMDEIYITNGEVGYVYTKYGLGQVSILPTTLGVMAGVLRGVVVDSGDNSGHLTSDVIDFGTRGMKTIDTVEVGGVCPSGLQVAISYRYSNEAAFEDTGWVDANPQGVVTIPCKGVDFKIKINCASYLGLEIKYVKARVKFDDKRFVRGTDAYKATA